jgi:hypothetical protein
MGLAVQEEPIARPLPALDSAFCCQHRSGLAEQLSRGSDDAGERASRAREAATGQPRQAQAA